MYPDTNEYLVVHGADPKRWAERYGIRPRITACLDCGAPRDMSICIASKDSFRGLMSPPCTCPTGGTHTSWMKTP